MKSAHLNLCYAYWCDDEKHLNERVSDVRTYLNILNVINHVRTDVAWLHRKHYMQNIVVHKTRQQNQTKYQTSAK